MGCTEDGGPRLWGAENVRSTERGGHRVWGLKEQKALFLTMKYKPLLTFGTNSVTLVHVSQGCSGVPPRDWDTVGLGA